MKYTVDQKARARPTLPKRRKCLRHLHPNRYRSKHPLLLDQTLPNYCNRCWYDRYPKKNLQLSKNE